MGSARAMCVRGQNKRNKRQVRCSTASMRRREEREYAIQLE
ncbi:hypothetical protein BIFANG_03197 [Bifidobacterium angulatum DSM 20098 = JCM 7096]|uniref:Uncharacterized protein n=1 Tax=Bifidobacterium angulatum DSM 20098 = JCM 7096 TaxID=518635 RepID=C4FFT3_9BIFI|nr:hypothetical protein BIFANG_03197 [Bifidobacterium angulatum DSM 20098 = JCM 7096]